MASSGSSRSSSNARASIGTLSGGVAGTERTGFTGKLAKLFISRPPWIYSANKVTGLTGRISNIDMNVWLDNVFMEAFGFGPDKPVTPELLGYFGSSRCSGFRLIGQGDHGKAILFNENYADGEPPRKLVLKYGIQESDNAMVTNELQALLMMRGNEHIIQLHAWDDAQDSGYESIVGKPIIVLEYLAGGHIGKLVERLEQTGERLPEPILWSMFLCLARICIAMAYPSRGGINAPVQKETVVGKEAVEPFPMRHDDMHLANILVGDMETEKNDTEHSFVPIIKLIDFGRARWIKHPRHGNKGGQYFNIFDIGAVMMSLVLGRNVVYELGSGQYDIPDKYGNMQNMTLNVNEKLFNALMATTFSADLRYLILRCAARNFANFQPSLEELEGRCAAAVQATDAVTRETMREITRKLIFNAPVPTPTTST